MNTSDSGLPFEEDAGVSGLGFISFVFPGRNWAAALYSHQLASLEFNFLNAEDFTRELSVQSYSASAGFQVTDRLSIGAGVSYYDADFGTFSPGAGTSDVAPGFNAGLLWNAAATGNWPASIAWAPNSMSGTAPSRPMDVRPRAPDSPSRMFMALLVPFNLEVAD